MHVSRAAQSSPWCGATKNDAARCISAPFRWQMHGHQIARASKSLYSHRPRCGRSMQWATSRVILCQTTYEIGALFGSSRSDTCMKTLVNFCLRWHYTSAAAGPSLSLRELMVVWQ